jgi:DNA-binding MarR family transcriptional regulator
VNESNGGKPLSGQEREVWQSALTLADALRSLVNLSVSATTGLSSADFLVLTRLEAAPEYRLTGLKALAAKLDWSASRLSHHLKRMNHRGLVHLDHDKNTGQLVISATEKSKEIMGQAITLHSAAVRRHFLELTTEQERATIIAISRRVQDRQRLSMQENGPAGSRAR